MTYPIEWREAAERVANIILEMLFDLTVEDNYARDKREVTLRLLDFAAERVLDKDREIVLLREYIRLLGDGAVNWQQENKRLCVALGYDPAALQAQTEERAG